MDNNYPMKVRVSYKDVIYEGMLHNYESYSNEPHIVMASYIIKDLDYNVISDFSDDNTKVIVLNTSDATKVEILYFKDSEMCEDLKELCSFNRKFQK
ncbi:MAG: hypothetical protein IJ711_03750 [Lachnospiraceae bacterium]|nr:hypothetical protein [Lachnospiraceae bacterium]